MKMRFFTHLIFVGLLIFVAATMVTPVNVFAEQGGLAYPDLSECQIAPRSAESLAELLATPIMLTATSAGTPQPLPAKALPTGEAAGQEVLVAINATLRELVACMNAGDMARALAFVADTTAADELSLLFGEDIVLNDPPTPVAESERTPFFSIRDPRLLADEQVGVIVSNPAKQGATFFMIFEQDDNGHWLITSITPTEAAGIGGP